MKITRGFRPLRPETRFGDSNSVLILPSDSDKVLSILIPKPLLPSLPLSFFLLLEDNSNLDLEDSQSFFLESFVS